MSPSEIREPTTAALEAVYNLNKHAKKYARLADENYRKGNGATAKANSIKKNALYGAKSRAINRFLLDGKDDLRDVERHEINGEPFLCLYFEDERGTVWSFHQPESEVHTSRIPSGIDVTDRAPEDFEDFDSGEDKDHSKLSLKTSLLHLEACGINTNHYLDQEYVSYGRNQHFAGWAYLGDGGERTDPTPMPENPEVET